MRCLFIHQNFPGQFKFWAAELSARPNTQVAGLGDAENLRKRAGQFAYPVFGYRVRAPNKSGAHHYLTNFETAIRRGQDVVRACQQMRAKGFVPDLIVGHPAWGELLFVKDVFPAARLIAYFEFFTGRRAVMSASTRSFPCKPMPATNCGFAIRHSCRRWRLAMPASVRPAGSNRPTLRTSNHEFG